MTTARKLRLLQTARAVRVQSAWWTALAVLLLTTATFAQRQPHPEAAGGNLPPLAQARISAAIGEDQRGYHAFAQPGGLRMENVDHAVSAAFTSAGVDFRQGPHRWGMALRAYGYEGTLRHADLTAPVARTNRVEYRRGALTEWYVNGPVGLEQGFTLDRAPGAPNGEPLTLAFTLSGDLAASVDPGRRSVTLRKGPAATLRYGGLVAVDADGRELPAWLDTAGDRLRIRVDDSDARYPVTIDPFVQAVKLTSAKPCDLSGICDDGATGDYLGFALSISADASTVVATAPFKYATSFARGVAYVFLRPSEFDGGWNSWLPLRYKAKLIASDGNTNGLFLGYSSDISRDGGTIVLGAPAFVPPGGQVGAAYVFVRPSNGWDTVAVHTQLAKLTPAPPSGTGYRGSFGLAVAISGDGATIAVGESSHRLNGVTTGAAYTFLKPATGWVNAIESQKFIATHESYFGSSVALSDDGRVMIVGASGEDPAGGERNDEGTAYVMTRRSNPGAPDSYSSVARLVASDSIPFDLFGHAISADADGGTVVVAAPGDYSDSVPHYGALYVFRRPAAGWAGSSITETAKLTASDASTAIGSLGTSVDISVDGKTILAATYPRVGQTAPPVAYFFAKPATGWTTATEDTTIGAWDVLPADAFGQSAALSGDGSVALVGAPLQQIDASIFRGAAYVFTGAAATPRASVSPTSLTFGPQPIGSTSSPQTVTVTNTGSAPLHVTSVAVIGPYTATQNCVSASPIAPGSSCSASVRFAPVSMGSAPWGTLTFTDDSGGISGALQQVALQGEPQTASTVTTISLPATVLVGQAVEVFYSVLPASGGTVTPFGPVHVQASTGEGCGGGGPADSGSCFLVFTNPITRTVTATYNGNNSFEGSTSAPATLRVTDFTLSATPSSQSVSGKKAMVTLTVGAVNGFTGAVALTCSGGPANSTCALAATVTVSGASATTKATVTVAAGTASGSYTMTFTATSGGVTRSTTATLIVK